MPEYQAYAEALRVHKLVAFNVKGYSARRTLNQFARRYTFPDGSELKVSHRFISAMHRNAEYILTLPSRVSAFGDGYPGRAG